MHSGHGPTFGEREFALKRDYLWFQKPFFSSVVLCGIALWNFVLSAPGDVDLSFDAGSHVDGVVHCVVAQPDGKVLIGGAFRTVRGGMRSCVARLNGDGTVDSSFNAGLL